MTSTKVSKVKKNNITPILGKVLKKIAPKIGAKVFIEPKWNIVGQITFKNGKKKYFRYSTLDINTLGASEIAKDKGYANFFMEHLGYPTIPGRTFHSEQFAQAIGSNDKMDQAFKYGKKIGFPIIVKPNSGSQGSGVALVSSKKDFYRAMKDIFKKDRTALVQKYISGRDYRVVVLDDKIVSAYERIPLNVTGDGTSTIIKLLKKKQVDFIKMNRDTKIKIVDPRISEKMSRQKLDMGSILKNGEKIFLLDNANLSTGGDSVDVTKSMHPEFKKIAIKLTKDMGLRLCGVDLMIQGSIEEKPNKYFVIEINSAPGLDHYASSGKAQEKIVEDLYLEVLKSMEKY